MGLDAVVMLAVMAKQWQATHPNLNKFETRHWAALHFECKCPGLRQEELQRAQ